MKLAIIVAMANNRVIGYRNQMPWHLSADLKRFKQITLGSPIIMGRKTFESIGRVLPERTNIVISRNPNYTQANCLVFHNIESVLKQYQDTEQTVFVIGGAELYQVVLPYADILYLTQIHQDFEGDTFFPEFELSDWREIAREDITDDKQVNFNYSFLQFVKNKA